MGVMNRFMNFLGLQEEEEEIIEREQVIEQDEEDQEERANRNKNKNNVVSIHSTKGNRVVLAEPRSYEEAQQMADQLKNRRTVVVNLQRVRPDQALRIVDFLSGTVYALNGNISKLGVNIFLCTPDSVEISGTITDMLNNET